MTSSDCKIVSFSGIDGAGKGTQIESLRLLLQSAGLRVSQLAFWDDVATCKWLRESTGRVVFQGDQGVGTPEAPIERKDKNVRAWPMTLVRLGMYIADAFALRRVIGHRLRSGCDVLICDRYIYDELANLPLENRLARWYVAQIRKIVPAPHVAFLLDADPVETRARKPEYPLDFLHSNRASYLILAALVGIRVVPPGSVDRVRQEIQTAVFDALPAGERFRSDRQPVAPVAE